MTNVEDAKAAVEAGADAIGFIFVPTSPRCVTRRKVSEILRELPDTVMTVGVVADENPDFLRGLLRVCPLKAIQFHGEEPPEQVLALKGQARLIKAIRAKGVNSLAQIPRYRGVEAVLLDAYRADYLGGTGQAFNWNLAVEAKSHGLPIIVAGGLTPMNVAEMIKQVRPYGVDVVSGVEASAGRKDPALVREFILLAKSSGSA